MGSYRKKSNRIGRISRIAFGDRIRVDILSSRETNIDSYPCAEGDPGDPAYPVTLSL
jgi:hypothetical protein